MQSGEFSFHFQKFGYQLEVSRHKSHKCSHFKRFFFPSLTQSVLDFLCCNDKKSIKNFGHCDDLKEHHGKEFNYIWDVVLSWTTRKPFEVFDFLLKIWEHSRSHGSV